MMKAPLESVLKALFSARNKRNIIAKYIINPILRTSIQNHLFAE